MSKSEVTFGPELEKKLEKFGSSSDCGVSVGCILFAAETELAKVPQDFFAQLKQDLSSIENVTELKIEGTDNRYGTIDYVIDPFDRKVRTFPHTIDSVIYYKIFIPFKVQDELGFRCSKEHFEVFNVHHYNHAVTYIPYDGDGGGVWSSSNALALVREYLKGKLADGEINISTVAPSPFHADFRAVPSRADGPIEETLTERNFRTFFYSYNQSSNNHLKPFIDIYGDVLALYYQLEKAEDRSHTLRSSISDCVTKLLSDEISVWRRFHSSGGIKANIDQIHKNVLEAKAQDKVILKSLEREETGVEPRSFSDLEYFFRRIRRRVIEGDYSDALSIAGVYEARNWSFLQNSAVLFAGLFGGLLGALITASVN